MHAAQNVGIQPVAHHKRLFRAATGERQGVLHHGRLRLADEAGALAGGGLDHVADGPAVRQVAELHRADQIRVGGDVFRLALGEQAAYILNLLVIELVVVGHQHAVNATLQARGDAQAVFAAFLQKRIGGETVDQLIRAVFFQVLNGGISGGNVLVRAGLYPQPPEKADVIPGTAGGVVGDEDELPATLTNGLQKGFGTVDQALALADGAVDVQQKEFFLTQLFHRRLTPFLPVPPAPAAPGRDRW